MKECQIKIKLNQKQQHKAKTLVIKVFLQKLVKKKEVENNIQDSYDIHLLNQLSIIFF